MITVLVVLALALGFYAGGAVVTAGFAWASSVIEEDPVWREWRWPMKVAALCAVSVVWPVMWVGLIRDARAEKPKPVTHRLYHGPSDN